MDDFLDRFLSGESVPRQTISGGTTNGRIRTEYEETTYFEDTVPEQTKKYAKPFIDKLEQEVWKRFDRHETPEREETTDIYERYNFSRHLRAARLPIEDHKDEILQTIRQNNVVVLRGPTGSGKTTKVPQFILDEYRQKQLYCNIIVAQPRRIAASSNAKRVCNERSWICGSIVGYQVGSDHRENCSEDTRVLFCTTGVFVESLIHGHAHNPLNRYTHIILDEVHERDKDMDFLMIAIYKYLNPAIRVILMSATIDVQKFAKYYKIPQNFATGRAPIIELGAQRNFHVEKIYLDNLEPLVDPERFDTPDISEQMYRMALKLIVFFEKADREHSIANGVDLKTYEKRPKPSVLVFLPGIYEIKQMHHRLEEWCTINDETQILRIVMHSTSDPLLNELAMMESDKNTRKIILATNIAESSITVPDVKYVIDFCLSRTLVVNPITKFPMLQLVWASRDNCEQRAGRTGRVTNGWCFRLVSRKFYETKIKQSTDAELLTNPLENIILKAKQLNLGSPEEVLALALDKPYLNDIHEAVLRLKEMGAMLTTTNGKTYPRDGDLTYIGEVMSRLPIDVKLSKLIALGYCFGVLDDCIIIAAALNSKNFFSPSRVQGIRAYTKRLEFADGSGSDLFALFNAYKTWKRLRGQGVFGNVNNVHERKAVQTAEKKWAVENFLEISSLRECFEKVKELRFRISRMHLLHSIKSAVTWSKMEKYIVLKVVIAGAFYPNYFSRSTKTQRSEEAEIFKRIGGRDPSDTVYFSAFNCSDLPHMYIKTIKNILLENYVINEKDFHNVTVSNDGVAERVYVSFKKSGKEGDIKEYGVACQPGVVLTEVYKAAKLGKMKGEHTIEVLSDQNTALCYARDNGLDYTHDLKVCTKQESEFKSVCYPRKSDEYIRGYISHTENCGRFWFQPNDYMDKIDEIYNELNNPNSDLEPFENAAHVPVGQILAAAYPSNKGQKVDYYRAKVIFIERKKSLAAPFEVRFIDFGNTRMCRLNELKRLRGVAVRYLSEPPCCFQCALAFIQPSHINCANGVWKHEGKQRFVEKTDGIQLKVKVFSVVNGIVRVTLNVDGQEETINKYLIDIRAASHCEESYMSKHDNIEREISRKEERSKNNYLTREVIRHLQEEEIPIIEPPSNSHGRTKSIRIKGPFTPLEINLYGLTRNSSGNPRIEVDSVNHVLLENEPNDMSEKYLVAVTAHQNDQHTSLIVRQTTLMPDIRLIGPLMAAIFAPKMKLKCNEAKTHYVKMMTGLGCDKNNVCLSSETNMTFDLDVELKNTDIITINDIRRAINCLLSRDGQKYAAERKSNIMKQLQEDLIGLLSATRLLLASEYESIKWGPYNRNELDLNLNSDMNKQDQSSFLPPHQYLRLNNPNIEVLTDLKNHHKELKKKRFATNDDPTKRSERCKICLVDIDEGIRLHLMSRQHKDRMRAIEFLLKN